MIGPVLLLNLKGKICPCLESEQDQAAREAASSIEHLPIRYYTDASSSTSSSSENNNGGVGGFVSGLFGKSAASSLNKVISNGTIGRLSLVDSASHGPSLCFEQYDIKQAKQDNASSNPDEDDDDEDDDDGDLEKGNIKTIPLKKIGEVVADDSFLGTKGSGIVLHQQNNQQPDGGGEEEASLELIRFDIRKALDSKRIVDGDSRDEVLDQLFSLVQWDRQRRSASGDNDEDENNNDEEFTDHVRGGPSTKKKKNVASKIKHFAQREIELTKQKRDREKKKAKYMKESGGLKYTAIAMANRA